MCQDYWPPNFTANFDHFPKKNQSIFMFSQWKNMKRGKTCAFFLSIFFFAPHALLMDFADFRENVGINPNNLSNYNFKKNQR